MNDATQGFYIFVETHLLRAGEKRRVILDRSDETKTDNATI